MIEPGPTRFYLAPWLIVAVILVVLWAGLIAAVWQIYEFLAPIL